MGRGGLCLVVCHFLSPVFAVAGRASAVTPLRSALQCRERQQTQLPLGQGVSQLSETKVHTRIRQRKFVNITDIRF